MSDDDRRALYTICRILTQADTDEADFTITAQHIITALRGHGWRPTNATRPEPWQPDPNARLVLPTEEYLAARKALDALAAASTELSERLAQTEGTHAATGGQP